MQPRKLRVGIVRFVYGGNGGIATEVPDVGTWLVRTVIAAKSDPRIEEVLYETFSDTPITLTRNRSIQWAKVNNVDVLVMLDSDMAPDLYLGKDPSAKSFFESSFDFLYANWEKGPHIVVSPYCGPPAHPTDGGFENVYVFHWEAGHTGHLPSSFKMQAYTRHEAAVMTGTSNIDTGPTGLSMYDVRIFDVIPHPYFDYEWEAEGGQCGECHQQIPGPRSQKASTEDCFFFRNVAINACELLGYNPVYCNWDSWSGHWKPWCVGKPAILTSDGVGRQLKQAVLSGVKMNTKVRHIGKSQAELRKEFEAQKNDPVEFHTDCSSAVAVADVVKAMRSRMSDDVRIGIPDPLLLLPPKLSPKVSPFHALSPAQIAEMSARPVIGPAAPQRSIAEIQREVEESQAAMKKEFEAQNGRPNHADTQSGATAEETGDGRSSGVDGTGPAIEQASADCGVHRGDCQESHAGTTGQNHGQGDQRRHAAGSSEAVREVLHGPVAVLPESNGRSHQG